MKSLFDRTKVYLLQDSLSDENPAAQENDSCDIDGISVHVTEGLLDTLDNFLRAHTADTLDILLTLDAPFSENGIRALMLCIKRHEMTGRILLLSPHHKMLDALKKAEPELQISPLCDENLVRPWIYAGYLGAKVICMDARDLLLDADAYGSEAVDRAHNSNIRVYAWNADDADTIKALVRIGCDAVLTHVPALARTLVW